MALPRAAPPNWPDVEALPIVQLWKMPRWNERRLPWWRPKPGRSTRSQTWLTPNDFCYHHDLHILNTLRSLYTPETDILQNSKQRDVFWYGHQYRVNVVCKNNISKYIAVFIYIFWLRFSIRKSCWHLCLLHVLLVNNNFVFLLT